MASTSRGTKPSGQPLSSTRLYVGNLSNSVDEYSLMQLCSRHGRIAKLDFLFHKTGPLKGKPRGYAFVEFATPEEAQRARLALHDKLIRGRKITVTAASEQAFDERTHVGSSSGRGGYHHRTAEPVRPSTISLLKGQGVTNASTDRKIAALEAKLAAMKQSRPSPSPSRDSTPGAAPTGTAEEFLATLDQRPAADPAETEHAGDAEQPPDRKISIDAVKAGLPAKPDFKVDMPS